MIREIINNKWDKVVLFLSFILAFILLPAYFETYIAPVDLNNSIDPSWVLTLNHVKMQGLIWGKDIIFTYGPLGYLSTKVGWGRQFYDFLLFDLFVFINFYLIFYTKLKNSSNKALTVTVSVFISLFLPAYFGAGTAIILFAFFLFWLLESYQKNSLTSDFFIGSLLVLMLFIKLNTGIVSFFLFVLLTGLKIYEKKSSVKRILILYASILVSIVIFSLILKVEIIDYVLYSFESVKGFNETMRLDLNLNYELYLAYILFLMLILKAVSQVYKSKFSRSHIFLAVLILFPTYILFKQGFVRGDLGHISEFFIYLPLLLFVVDFYPFDKLKNREIIVALCFLSFLGGKRKEDNILDVNAKFNKKEYFAGIGLFNETSGMHLFPNDNTIPEQVRRKIQNSKVDIFPWNSHLLFENKINYASRPVVQSYAAYTKGLEDANFNFYNDNKTAPEFVIYEYESTDNRYPLFDESKVNLVLKRNYLLEDEFEIKGRKYLLLKKKSNFKPIGLVFQKEMELAVDAPLAMNQENYYEIYVSNSLKGRLVNLIKRQPEIFVMLNTKDGKSNGYKTSISLLESGVYNDALILNTEDFKNYISNQSISNDKVLNNLVVWPEKKDNFGQTIKVKQYKITQ